MVSMGLLARNFKCIATESQGFVELKLVNLIVGRNNSGKSALLDLVSHATQSKRSFDPMLRHKGAEPELFTRTMFDEEDAKSFPASTSGGTISGNHYEFGKRFLGSTLTTHFRTTHSPEIVNCEPAPGSPLGMDQLKSSGYIEVLATSARRNPLVGKTFWRLAAERNIVPEPDNLALQLDPNGTGCTNLIQAFINKSTLPSELVEVDLLEALNIVFNPDAHFTDIVCQQHSTNHWEIYLAEEHKGRIALSQSGSGLKTVILCLCSLFLLPVVLKQSLKNFVFAYEELENNLHPALQRRLLNYLASRSAENKFPIFLTSHSSVAIDMFARTPDAQILHVTHDGQSAAVRTVKAYIENKGVLDDLDIRASDLLQANGIIWVEGPSDRIYLNRWIALWSDGKLREGNHYQCVFYGGRLLAHLSGRTPDEDSDHGLSILHVNRNAAILIDSDRRSGDDDLNATKKRVIREVEEIGGTAWVTTGREIENYNSGEVVASWLKLGSVPDVDPHADFFDYLDSLQAGLGKKFRGEKPLLAEQIGLSTCREDLESNKHLAKKLDCLCEKIRGWNRLGVGVTVQLGS